MTSLLLGSSKMGALLYEHSMLGSGVRQLEEGSLDFKQEKQTENAGRMLECRSACRVIGRLAPAFKGGRNHVIFFQKKRERDV